MVVAKPTGETMISSSSDHPNLFLSAVIRTKLAEDPLLTM